jgi:hypothetical protein
MVAANRHVLRSESAGVLAKTFWELAGREPDGARPIDVARCAARALDSLERSDRGPRVTASPLSFLLRLDSDRVYAAPEQVRGERTNQRSLVFTVGVLVFERITGVHPFGAAPSRATTDDDVDANVPPELRAVLETAMAPFPADRWSSLRALRTELERFVTRESSQVIVSARQRRRSVPPPCPGSAVRRVTGSRVALAPAAPARRTTSVATPPPIPKRAPEPPLVDIASLEEPRRAPALARSAILVAAGAALAVLAMWLVRRPSNAVADSPEPVDLPALIVDAVPAPDPAPVPVPVPAPVPDPVPDPAPAATTFNPDAGGDAALAAARTCFSEQRLARGVELSASLRFTVPEGVSSKIYWAPDQKLSASERACATERLTGLAAGAPPERATVVSYTLWLHADVGRFWAKQQKR